MAAAADTEESFMARDGEEWSYCKKVPPVTHGFGAVSGTNLLLVQAGAKKLYPCLNFPP